MKLKPKDLKVGDIIYPTIYGTHNEIICCAKVEEINTVYDIHDFHPVQAVLVDRCVWRTDGSFFHDKIKLTDDEEYEVIYREN